MQPEISEESMQPTWDVRELFKESEKSEDTYTIGTTVDSGFECQAKDECREKLGKDDSRILKELGKLHFNISSNDFSKIQEMRSIDHILIIGNVHVFNFSETDKEFNLTQLRDAARAALNLEKSLNLWKRVTNFPGVLYPTREEFQMADKKDEISKEEKKEMRGRKRGQDPSYSDESNILRYRVTCERRGKHTFESGDAARIIGGELQDKYHWIVDLTSYHLEIICRISDNEMVTYLRVTHQSKHHRNISYFGPTTLRATVCYNILRLTHPKPGEVIIDPMCGAGSIPIEATLAYKNNYVLCGDNHEKAVNRTKLNIDVSSPRNNIDSTQWNVEVLPLKDSCIDIVATDMPFGKRSGKVSDNRILYKKLLLELGRVVRHTTGRLVLLTYDRRSLKMALQAAGDLFWVTKILGVNIGGLQAVVYVLKRTNVEYQNFKPKVPKSHPQRLKNE